MPARHLTDMSHRLGGLALLVLLSGCATTTSPGGYAVSNEQVSRPEPRPVVPPSSGPTVQSPSRLRPPATLEQPSTPVEPVKTGPDVRIPRGAAARLLNLPAAIAAILLWPIDLSDDASPSDWKNTVDPVTLLPWSSEDEYDQFWTLPQAERERLIQESRTAMASSMGAASEPKSQEPSRMASRRNPNQTCEDSVLDTLQAEKDRICQAVPRGSCSRRKASAKRLAKMPCSQIRLRIQALRNCISIRQFIQDECFGGTPDAPHEKALDELQGGLEHCLALEAENCAPGHPMADL